MNYYQQRAYLVSQYMITKDVQRRRFAKLRIYILDQIHREHKQTHQPLMHPKEEENRAIIMNQL